MPQIAVRCGHPDMAAIRATSEPCSAWVIWRAPQRDPVVESPAGLDYCRPAWASGSYGTLTAPRPSGGKA